MYLLSHMVIIDFCIVSPTPLQIKLWDVGLMLVHRLRRWSNIKALSGRRRVLAGLDKVGHQSVIRGQFVMYVAAGVVHGDSLSQFDSGGWVLASNLMMMDDWREKSNRIIKHS